MFVYHPLADVHAHNRTNIQQDQFFRSKRSPHRIRRIYGVLSHAWPDVTLTQEDTGSSVESLTRWRWTTVQWPFHVSFTTCKSAHRRNIYLRIVAGGLGAETTAHLKDSSYCFRCHCLKSQEYPGGLSFLSWPSNFLSILMLIPLPNIWLISGASVGFYVLLKAYSFFHREFNSTLRSLPGLSSWNVFTGNIKQLILTVCPRLLHHKWILGAQEMKGSN